MGDMRPVTGSGELDQLTERVGWTAMARVAKAYGGQRIYFPKKPSAQIIEKFGPDIAAALCDAYGGGEVYFSLAFRRDMEIREAHEKNPRWTLNEIANEVGVSYRTVQLALHRGVREVPPRIDKRDSRQASLF